MRVNIGLEEALQEILNKVNVLSTETVPFMEALGRVVAEDIIVDHNLPESTQAAVDGFALAGEVSSGQQQFLVKGRLGPGDIPKFSLSPGEAVGVVTGGFIPPGTTAVIPGERVTLAGEYITTRGRIAAGSNLKQPGEDFTVGETVVRKGHRVTPGMIGLMAALGIAEVQVFRRPRIAILSLGPQIIPYYEMPVDGQLRDSNGPLLAALVTRDGGQVNAVEVVGSGSNRSVSSVLMELLSEADLVITNGGTYSSGNGEAVQLFKEIGAEILFWTMPLKPGGHPGAAVWNSKLLVSLSGNPAGCTVGYELLVAPVLAYLQGLDPYPYRVMAICNDDYQKTGGPRRFVRGHASCNQDGWSVTVLPGQKPSMLRSLLYCNALIDLPAGHPPLKAGAEVPILLLTSNTGNYTVNRDTDGNEAVLAARR
ncbi:MAG: molybdopterin molybdotransferase MoeA [Syntrophomonadaceae bacterium]|nr:molybdopterin molybdotransferase MoeA [Syntrophomonadaceae bacterium]